MDDRESGCYNRVRNPRLNDEGARGTPSILPNRERLKSISILVARPRRGCGYHASHGLRSQRGTRGRRSHRLHGRKWIEGMQDRNTIGALRAQLRRGSAIRAKLSKAPSGSKSSGRRMAFGAMAAQATRSMTRRKKEHRARPGKRHGHCLAQWLPTRSRTQRG